MQVHTMTQILIQTETLPNWKRESNRVLRWADNLPPGISVQITCPGSRSIFSVEIDRKIGTATTFATKEWRYDGPWEYDTGVVSDSPTGQVLLAAVPHLFIEVPEPEWVPTDDPDKYDGVPADTGSN